MRVQLTFRSGAQVVVDVEAMQVTYDGPAGKVSRIQWKDAPGGNRPLAIVAAEVVAVVELDAQPPPPPHRYSHAPGVPVEEHPHHPGISCEQYHDQRTDQGADGRG